ncbi:fork head domain-containing protein, partial [Mycena pura]
DYLRRQLCLSPGVPVDLWAIADPPDGQKPFASLPTLIKLALHGSARQRLTLQGICDALVARFTWFRAHQLDDAWKNSVRHNLSLNKVFRKVPRDVKQMGKGCFWELDLSGGEGHKRARKR